ncbi:MAG: nuclear transport factor 2 family protein [Phycisphaerae bacterium]|nr:nuclear transport factor 2 family protein [Phycisphaerae bacterium]
MAKAKGKGRRTKASKPSKSGAKKTVKSGRIAAPKVVKTGRGPGAAEIGASLVSMFNAGKLEAIEKKWWSPAIESIEGVGVAMSWKGEQAVRAKGAEWMASHRIHGASAEGPYVGATGFAVKLRMDVEDTKTGQRTMMEEVGVYTVMNGKIVREEFMYGG